MMMVMVEVNRGNARIWAGRGRVMYHNRITASASASGAGEMSGGG
jgi:hypothetical protein